ncbi:hypothetical protein M409DRAFT_61777 [Zasmidium cellare ATCC 36951]|uniref:Uncharacterized protein n=1 Tax=Zasmidium cellare ATCC 36951 TaxID=1080233 RepID=A0A6A6BU22_ZASCE|nr:uncharacterized protein M409DRAFT_61777 [Zasmidium cellare ATCC 36951]KAF2158304.1 hypothetical protein M409DRAFT_61777 [Zasmidium cellare ATCC 36951]
MLLAGERSTLSGETGEKSGTAAERGAALGFLEHAIQDRTAVGSREASGWKATTTTHHMLCDVQSLIAHVEEDRPTSITKTSQKTQSTGSDEETLELISSKGMSNVSAFGGSRESTNKTPRSTTKAKAKPLPTSKGRKAKPQTTDDIEQLQTILQEESARRAGERQPGSIVNDSDIQVTVQEGRSCETVTVDIGASALTKTPMLERDLSNEPSQESLNMDSLRPNTFGSVCDSPPLPLWHPPRAPEWYRVTPETTSHVGISAAQSTLLQCIDKLLGTQQSPRHQDAVLREARIHLPRDHRCILQLVDIRGPS